MRRGILFCLFFLSGCCALVYELVCQRYLNLIFGVSTLSVSAVLAAFMGGLALGGLLFGRLADRTGKPLRIYAMLEGGIGFCALLLPFAFSWMTPIYISVYSYLQPGQGMGALLRFILAFPLVAGLACLIGGTFPLMGRLVVPKTHLLASRFSWLYTINTAGAVLGAALTGFVLLRCLGMKETLWLAAAFNILIAFGAIVLSWFATHRESLLPDLNENASIAAAPPGSQATWSIVLVAGLTGLASMGLEVVWARILGILTSNSAFGFALMLTVLLTGLCLGGMIHALWSRFSGDSWKRLAWTQGTLIAVVLATLPYLRVSPDWLDRCCDGSSITKVFLGELALTSFAVLLPGILMGLSLPLIVAGTVSARTALGHWLGRIYAVNTLGCVIGAFGTGFVLIPWLGIHSSIGLLLGASLAVILIAWLHASVRNRIARWGGACSYVVLFGLILCLLPAGGYFKSRIEEPRQLVYYREGNNGTVSVIEEGNGMRSILVDGQPVAGTFGTSVIDQKMLAHLPLLLHPDPHRALTVGFGSGGTSWSMTLHGIDVDCVEIEKAVPAAADHFTSENHGIPDHPHFHLVLDDARSWLRVAPAQYDAIVTDCTNIQYRSNGDLYTVDYFQLMKDRLDDRGLAAAWVPANGIPESDLKTLLRSFRQVFPHTSVWYMNSLPTDFLIVVGSPARLRIDMEELSQRMRQSQVAEDLAAVGLADPNRLVHSLLLGEDNLAVYLDSGDVNTDDRPILSYSTYGATFQRTIATNLLAMLSCQENPDAYVTNAPSTEAMLRQQVATTEVILGHVSHWAGSEKDALFHYAKGAEILPGDAFIHRLVVAAYFQLREQGTVDHSACQDLPPPLGN
jgi:spermidine synthase